MQGLLGFLQSLSGVPSLFLLSMGVALLVASAADKLPIANMELSPRGRLVLLIVAFLLISIFIWSFIMEKLSSQKKQENDSKIQELTTANEEIKQKNQELENSISEVIKLIEGKPEKNPTDIEALQILMTNIVPIVQELQGAIEISEAHTKASSLVKSRKKDWIGNWELSEYLNLDLPDTKYDKQQFKDNIEKLMNLLDSNIINKGLRNPRVEGLNLQHAPVAYTKAMKDIQSRMNTYLDDNKENLSDGVINTVKENMQFLIVWLND